VAKYLDIELLFDLTCNTMANIIADKYGEEVFELFNLIGGFSRLDEEATTNKYILGYVYACTLHLYYQRF
jgi:hypothetical protein